MKSKLVNASLFTVFVSIIVFTVCIAKPDSVQAATQYDGLDYSSVYDMDYYYSQNGDLQSALGHDAEALWNHFVNYGMSEGRVASPNFDVKAYRNRYGDLNQAYGDDWRQYYSHYVKYGAAEGRNGSVIPQEYLSLVFDAQNYMNRNLDIRIAYGDDTKGAYKHFLVDGMAEGRQACNTFDVKAYKAANPDLQRAFGDNYEAYVIHYITYGQYEHRVTTDAGSVSCGSDNMENTYSAVFDANVYLHLNKDVANAFGNDSTLALRHFLSSGMTEGRQASKYFDVNYYRASNPDLNKAFGNSMEQYYIHYIRYGKKEGRTAYDPTRIYGLAAGTIGIDVSAYQKTIDWNAVKNSGTGFAIIRVGLGSDEAAQDDSTAIYNMNQCEQLGIPYGVYLFSYAVSDDEANSEVAHLLRMLQNRNPVMGVYVDIENDFGHYSEGYYQHFGLDPYSTDGRTRLTRYANIILGKISAAGYKAGVYASYNYFNKVLYKDQLSNYKWLAEWGSEPELPGCQLWQYTSDGAVNGITGRVDMDKLLENWDFY